MTKPVLVAVAGMSGTGKSTLAVALAAVLPDAVHIDSDKERKKMFGVPETEKLPAEAYTFETSQKLLNVLDTTIGSALRAGKNVVLSSTFYTAGSIPRTEKTAAEAGASFMGILLQADVMKLFDRVSKRVNDASDAGIEVVTLQDKKRIEFPAHWHRIDAGRTREEVLADALEIVNARSVPPKTVPKGPAA